MDGTWQRGLSIWARFVEESKKRWWLYVLVFVAQAVYGARIADFGDWVIARMNASGLLEDAVRGLIGPLGILLLVVLALLLWSYWDYRRMPASAGTFIEDDAPRYREDPWKRAAITFLTWLYRRDETGLSDEQMEAESVPVSTKYARDRLDHVGLSSLTYERRLDIGPEPWRKSPDPHPHPERPTGIRVTGSSDVQLLDNRFSGDMDAIVADKTTGLTAERNIVDAKPPKAVWPPALDDVPAAGRRARVQDYTSSRDEVITLGKNLKSRLWGYSLYQLERKKGSLEEQERAFMAAVDRHKTDWWMKGRPGAVDLGTKVEPVNPAAQVLWQAEMSARIDAELKWFDEHPVP